MFGSDLFAGYYGMERHQYEQMPLFPLAQAAIFRLFGTGVVQMRALPVACGLLLLWWSSRSDGKQETIASARSRSW